MQNVSFSETRITEGRYITGVQAVAYIGPGAVRGLHSRFTIVDGLLAVDSKFGKVKVTKLRGNGTKGLYSLRPIGRKVQSRVVYLTENAVLYIDGQRTTVGALFA